MEIRRVTSVDDDVVDAFARLVPQLSQATPPTRDELAGIARDAMLLLAVDDGEIVGALTLTVYRIPTGLQARIDDVVVDGRARGRGVGEALTREAIAIARQAGAKAVSLTSRPDREAANRLYQRLGFEPVRTNVYRFRL
jgi:ribosomal protein S18 acetylase RimI-like enzyme